MEPAGTLLQRVQISPLNEIHVNGRVLKKNECRSSLPTEGTRLKFRSDRDVVFFC